MIKNKRFMEKVLLGLIIVSATFQMAGVAAPTAAEGSKIAQKGKSDGRGRALGRPPMADMSPEDRKAMKKALQAVWENPEVMQARDEVKRATETFQKAIKKALGQEDPRVAALVEKMHKQGKTHGKKRHFGSDGRGGRPPMGKKSGFLEHGAGGSGEGRRGIGPAGFRAFSGEFSDEEKERLRAARAKAMESEGFQAVQEKLKALLKEGENLRERRVEMFHATRVELSKAMIEVDPEVEVLLQRKKGRK